MDTMIFRTAGGFPEVIHVRVPASLNDEIERAAVRGGLSKAELVRRVLARGIADDSTAKV
jgi:hypothetical protein